MPQKTSQGFQPNLAFLLTNGGWHHRKESRERFRGEVSMKRRQATRRRVSNWPLARGVSLPLPFLGVQGIHPGAGSEGSAPGRRPRSFFLPSPCLPRAAAN